MSSGNIPGYAPGPRDDQPSLIPPTPVRVAFWLFLAAAALQLVALGLGLAFIASPAYSAEIARQLEGQDVPAGVVQSARNITIGVLIAIAVVAIGVYLLVAFHSRRGRNWARLTAAVFAALSLLSLAGFNAGSTSITYLQIALGIAAVVALYLRPSSAYFRARRNSVLGL
jgi:Trk-type K+ transport system membrane component